MHGKVALLSLVVFVGFAFVARALHRDGSHPIAAGVFAFISVSLFGAFLGALWTWFGWLGQPSSAFGGFHVARLSLVLLVADRGARRAPDLPLPADHADRRPADLVLRHRPDLGRRRLDAVVTFVIGLVFLAWAHSVDGGPNRPYGMWLHVGAGLTIGGSLLWFLHHGHFEWALIVVASLLYVKFASIFERASWAVLGSIGILAADALHDLVLARERLARRRVGGVRAAVPALVFGIAGALLVRARRVAHTAHPTSCNSSVLGR